MIKKVSSVIVSLSVIGITTLGLALSEHGDVPVPQRPDLAYSHGNTGGSPAYSHADFPVSADGDTGIISNENEHGDVPVPQNPDLAYNKGDTWSPQRSDLAYSHGSTGGSPADGHADTPAPQNPDLVYNIGSTPVQQA